MNEHINALRVAVSSTVSSGSQRFVQGSLTKEELQREKQRARLQWYQTDSLWHVLCFGLLPLLILGYCLWQDPTQDAGTLTMNYGFVKVDYFYMTLLIIIPFVVWFKRDETAKPIRDDAKEELRIHERVTSQRNEHAVAYAVYKQFMECYDQHLGGWVYTLPAFKTHTPTNTALLQICELAISYEQYWVDKYPTSTQSRSARIDEIHKVRTEIESNM